MLVIHWISNISIHESIIIIRAKLHWFIHSLFICPKFKLPIKHKGRGGINILLLSHSCTLQIGWLDNALVNLQLSLQCGRPFDYKWFLRYPRPHDKGCLTLMEFHIFMMEKSETFRISSIKRKLIISNHVSHELIQTSFSFT